MAIEGSAKAIKYLVLFFNLLFFILGCCLIGIGVWGELEVGPYISLSSVNYATGPRVLIGIGVILTVVAFLGCCGAWKENKCMLSLFFVFLLILLVLEITAAVLAFTNRSKIRDELAKDIMQNLINYPHENGKPIDDLQSKLECCGANGPSDWRINADYKKNNETNTVPDSCCEGESVQDCGKGQMNNANKVYTKGCSAKLYTMIKNNLAPTGAFAIAVLVIQILGMIFALVLLCRINK